MSSARFRGRSSAVCVAAMLLMLAARPAPGHEQSFEYPATPLGTSVRVFVEAYNAADEEDLTNPCFLVSGLGLGHHLAELERRFARPLMIVAEDDLALLKAALCVTDLAAPLRNDRIDARGCLRWHGNLHRHDRLQQDG